MPLRLDPLRISWSKFANGVGSTEAEAANGEPQGVNFTIYELIGFHN